MGIKKILGYALYNLVFKHFPVSFSRIQVGQKFFRSICGRLLLDECGKNVNIEKNASFSPQCRLGNNSGIGVNASIGVAYIGNNVLMGPDCTILSSTHFYEKKDLLIRQQGSSEVIPVVIGNDVWIGCRVIILPGVNIGDGAVIGAGSIVTKDVEPYSVVAGNPARTIKYRR